MGKTEQPLPSIIGPYSILESLGKGGMGEVYLAKDPSCSRQIALKRVRPELRLNKTIQNRFLREAEVTSALSHPSIVPILSIHTSEPDIYYTMPFVEGVTLRQILRTNKEEPHPLRNSIPALARIFLQICEAIAYTHSKGILHRDLKPENIIVGKYGEVMILDWGIADFIDQIGEEEPLPEVKVNKDLTKPGKITGTLAYMAPERLSGKSSSVQTDIYALGVILYQMLTLQLPFQRKNIAAFRKTVGSEELIDPVEMAPYRDIPHPLSESCRKCLARYVKDRYKSVEELIREIKNYIEGKPLWVKVASLSLERKEDWRFQENVLLAKNIAITRSLDVTEWAELMVSKSPFAGNLRIEAQINLKPNSSGLGFLLSIPEESRDLKEGYCIWIEEKSCKLFKNNVQLLETKILEPPQKITIEKIDDHLKVFVGGKLKLNFASHLPLANNHVGLLIKDAYFDLESLSVFDASHNAMVGCLTVPNAFLSRGLYETALQEYRRIGQSFPGRLEGREALFRAGLTLIEKAKAEENDQLYHLALKEFEKLYRTPGAPLEYLGKSLVYEALGDVEEEAKCLELALRKFPSHPLLSMLKEHIVYRMHESSLNNREAAYRIILLAIRHIPDLLTNPDNHHLIDSLEGNLECLPFIEPSKDRLPLIAIQLAFWLAKVPILVEIAQSVRENEALFNNALVALQELEAKDALEKFLPKKARKKKSLVVWNDLLNKRFESAKVVFDKFPEAIFQETSPLHFPYGTYLYMTEGKAAAMRHFGAVLETRYPPTTALPSLFLTGRLDGWMESAFWWEKKELHRQIELFYRCVGKK
jgi:serine/threonine-protein kinase